ncbi:hypothetical protein [Actinomadura litoris]|uniref:hypothetical protein n=1 Tax=Actinomadura litoris TaxID=2678616 RepID=UPI001FA7EABB|nr:hypothetical protein [Actinomadura litoris]
MSGTKINPAFVIFAAAGFVIVGFALFGSTVAGAGIDDPDENKAEITLQLSAMLNYCVAGLVLVLIGVGFQIASGGAKTPAALPGPAPYGPPQPYQAQQPQAPGRPWGQQAPGPHPPAQG